MKYLFKIIYKYIFVYNFYFLFTIFIYRLLDSKFYLECLLKMLIKINILNKFALFALIK